jgi:hypothetical protein
MVKVGFIVEGDTEKFIVESVAFMTWLNVNGITLIRPVVNAKGGGNLLPQNIGPFVSTLQQAQAEHIVILTDQEHEASADAVRQRIGQQHTPLVFVAVKAIEAWFLADTQALRHWLGLDTIEEARPEETTGLPWERLKEIAAQNNKKHGPGSNKLKFAKRMINTHGFQIPRAAEHPHCFSALEFSKGITALGQPADQTENATNEAEG